MRPSCTRVAGARWGSGPRLAYPRGVQVMSEPEWRERTAAHEERVDTATSAHLARRRDHRKHPVEDFLFTYYSFKPAQLRRWHPGVGTGLAGAAGSPHDGWRFVRELLVLTAERPARFGCFGLHEWAMVYRLDPSDVRHSGWPLRLGASGTDAVVESHQVACSHFDAYRFFTPDAAPRNALRPTRESQPDREQPGCLHAGMDL